MPCQIKSFSPALRPAGCSRLQYDDVMHDIWEVGMREGLATRDGLPCTEQDTKRLQAHLVGALPVCPMEAQLAVPQSPTQQPRAGYLEPVSGIDAY